jgi:hypothetical protein
MRNLVPLVRRIAGDRLYSLPAARQIVNQWRGHCRTETCCTPGGQKTTAGNGTPQRAHPETAIAGTAIAWQWDR